MAVIFSYVTIQEALQYHLFKFAVINFGSGFNIAVFTFLEVLKEYKRVSILNFLLFPSWQKMCGHLTVGTARIPTAVQFAKIPSQACRA